MVLLHDRQLNRAHLRHLLADAALVLMLVLMLPKLDSRQMTDFWIANSVRV